MERGVNLHRRPEQGVVADADRADVQHHAVEVEEHPLAELDVRAVIAEERRLHPDGVAALSEQSPQDAPALVLLRLARGIEVLTEVARPLASSNQLGIKRVVHLAGQHLLSF